MKKIWVLDDDKSIRWVFEKTLSKANLPCQCFSNTNEAINIVEYSWGLNNLKEGDILLISDFFSPSFIFSIWN